MEAMEEANAVLPLILPYETRGFTKSILSNKTGVQYDIPPIQMKYTKVFMTAVGDY